MSRPTLRAADAQRLADAAFVRAAQAQRTAVAAHEAAGRARDRADAARARLVRRAADAAAQ